MAQVIVIVDDAARSLSDLGTYMEHWGYSVESPEIGQRLDFLVASLSPELIVLASTTPQAQALVEQLRQSPAGAIIPIFFVGAPTANLQSADDAHSWGADHFFVQPVDYLLLKERIGAYIGEGKSEVHPSEDKLVTVGQGDDNIQPLRHSPKLQGEADELPDFEWQVPEEDFGGEFEEAANQLLDEIHRQEAQNTDAAASVGEGLKNDSQANEDFDLAGVEEAFGDAESWVESRLTDSEEPALQEAMVPESRGNEVEEQIDMTRSLDVPNLTDNALVELPFSPRIRGETDAGRDRFLGVDDDQASELVAEAQARRSRAQNIIEGAQEHPPVRVPAQDVVSVSEHILHTSHESDESGSNEGSIGKSAPVTTDQLESGGEWFADSPESSLLLEDRQGRASSTDDSVLSRDGQNDLESKGEKPGLGHGEDHALRAVQEAAQANRLALDTQRRVEQLAQQSSAALEAMEQKLRGEIERRLRKEIRAELERDMDKANAKKSGDMQAKLSAKPIKSTGPEAVKLGDVDEDKPQFCPPTVLGGTLSPQFDVANMMFVMWREKVTGRIDLIRATVMKTVYFQKGRPVAATSNVDFDRMEDYLLRYGLISRDQYHVIHLRKVQSARQIGAFLVNEGLMKTKELYESVRGHFEEMMMSLFEWEEGSYHYAAEMSPRENHVHLEYEPPALILRALRLKYVLPRLISRVGAPSSLLAPRRNPHAQQERRKMALSPEESRLVTLVDGTRSVDDMVFSSDLSPLQVYAVLACLLVIGWAEVAVAGSEQDSGELLGANDAIDSERIRHKLRQTRESDYFDVLGVTRDSTPEEAEQAYRRMSQDFSAGKFSIKVRVDMQGELTEIGEVLADARSILADTTLRVSYARHLA
jgi:DNA-binding response OmpR family regulator